GFVDGGADAHIRGAGAYVAAHRVVDVGVGGLGVLREQGRGGHDLSRLAVAALGHVELAPGRLHGLPDSVGVHAFDRGDLLAGHGSQGRDARADRNPLGLHGTGAAQRHAAAVFGAGQVRDIAQRPQQRHFIGRIQGSIVAVDVQGGHGEFLLNGGARAPQTSRIRNSPRLQQCRFLCHSCLILRTCAGRPLAAQARARRCCTAWARWSRTGAVCCQPRQASVMDTPWRRGTPGFRSWRPASRWLSIMTPMMRDSPWASWRATSCATSTWRSWALFELACEQSIMTCSRWPAAFRAAQQACTLSASKLGPCLPPRRMTCVSSLPRVSKMAAMPILVMP